MINASLKILANGRKEEERRDLGDGGTWVRENWMEIRANAVSLTRSALNTTISKMLGELR